MLSNYLKVALRNFAKYKLFSAINVAGLAIGVAACLLILQYVSFKLSFDQFNTNLSNLYRVVNDRYQSEKLIQHGTITYSAIGRALKNDYNEVVNFARVEPANERIITYNDKKISEKENLFVDNSFVNMFSYPMLAGDKRTMLLSPHTVVLTESVARKIFNWKDNDYSPLIGRSITMQLDTTPYKIEGVMADVPDNSHLKFSMLLSFNTLISSGWKEADYTFTESSFWHYVQLRPGADYKALNARLDEFSKRHFDGTKVSGSDERFYLQPVSRAHLYSDFEYEIGQTGNGTVVWGLVIIALFIVAIAWFNYVNLSTARAVERAREVGIRKVIGGSRRQLIIQFLSESLLVNVFSIILAVIIVFAVQPFFNQLLRINLSLSYLITKGMSGYNIFISMVAIIVAGIIVSGFYPAFVLSGYKPINVLKGKLNSSGSGIGFRRALVVVQFSITIALMIGSMVVIRQIRFMSNSSLGFNMDQMLIVRPPLATQWDSTFITRVNGFKEEVKKLSHVKGAASSWSVPGGELGRSFNVRRTDSASSDKFTTRHTGVDYDYLQLYQVKLLAGRYFTFSDHNPDFDKLHNAIINRAAVRLLGFKSPEDAVGKTITSSSHRWDIVGVVEDYHQKSLRYPLEAVRFMPAYSTNASFSVKVSPQNVTSTIAAIKKQYDAFFPGNIFDYSFLDDNFNKLYDNEQLFAKVFAIFAILAIVVACLGMFGLAMFTTVQRMKEIGVRRVLGASVSSILMLLSRDFMRLILLSAVIACPLAWWVMHSWLEDFTYRTSLSWWIFVLSGSGALLVAIVTVSAQVLRAAVTNPVKSLRAE